MRWRERSLERDCIKTSLPVVVTPTRVELGLRCNRRHAIADILQYARYYSPSLEFGTVIHAGAAAWWWAKKRDFTLGSAKQAAIVAVRTEFDRRITKNPRVAAKDLSEELAISIIEGYTNEAKLNGPFHEEEGEWQIVSVEDRLEVPLVISGGRKAKLSFQTDRVVYNKTNRHLVIVDSKTAARIDNRWMRQWETSLQMKLYKAGAAIAYDFNPETIDVVVEGILKDVPTSIVYASTPDWSAALLDEAVRQAQTVAERDYQLITQVSKPIVEAALFDSAVNYADCYAYNTECPFRRLCVAEPNERVAILNAEYFEVPIEDQTY